MTTNKDLIGRDEINDLEAILSVSNTDADAIVHAVQRERRRDLHVGLRAQSHAAHQALREGEDVAVERHDRPRLVDRGRPGEASRSRTCRPDESFFAEAVDLKGTPFEKWTEKEWIQLRHRVAELDALAVHARRAGRAARAPRGSSRPCRGSTPSTTPRRR